jgi:hypothetical protein
VIVWDPRSRRFGPEIGTSVALIGVGRHHVVWRDDNCYSQCHASLTDTRTGRTEDLGSSVGNATASFSVNDEWVAIASYHDGPEGRVTQVAILDVASWRAMWTYDKAPLTGVLDIAWASSGRWVFFEDVSGQLAHRIGDPGVSAIRWPGLTYVRGLAIVNTADGRSTAGQSTDPKGASGPGS